jgi:beta-xylosidase
MTLLPYKNPVYAEYFADPFVWRAGEAYFAIGTGDSEAEGVVCESGIFPLLTSRDLVHWKYVAHALQPPDASFGSTFWAPEVVEAEGKWWLYYSVGHEDKQHQLRVASSSEPQGPYVDVAGLTSPEQCPFAIDAHAFHDEDGNWYLFHARDFLDEVDDRGQSSRVGTALVVYPLETMTKLSPHGRTVARARYDWQRFAANRMMYGRRCDWHTLEGPCVVKHESRYYCFYSGGCWQTETYGVDYIVADAVMGPYADEGRAEQPRVLQTVHDRVIGPGHCSVVLGPDRITRYIVYHAWDISRTARRMCIDPLEFTPQGPRCRGPTWDEQVLGVPNEEHTRARQA